MLKFLWIATRGYRFCPWKSPYLRWRIETYSGMPAERITARSFFEFLLKERGALWQYLRWVGVMAKLQR